MLQIVADENMPGMELFSSVGEVTRCAGRQLTAADLAHTDVLLVRSVTPVNESLLAGTSVKFVGSATIGTDHVDQNYLAAQGIGFAHAPGCNAMAVVEYVLQAILLWCDKQQKTPNALSLGVVGLGNVGSRLANCADALGMKVVACDPPRERAGDEVSWGWQEFHDVLQCDVISLHVPLIASGVDETRHLFDGKALQALSDHQLLINTCRGSVIDNRALLSRLRQPKAPTCVLDVWEDEPCVPQPLFDAVWLGSPHIAGYSSEGKLRGTAMVYVALMQWLGKSAAMPQLPVAGDKQGHVESWRDLLQLLRQSYRLEDDNQRLGESLSADDKAAAFDQLRKNYPLRHELRAWQQDLVVSAAMQKVLNRLNAD